MFTNYLEMWIHHIVNINILSKWESLKCNSAPGPKKGIIMNSACIFTSQKNQSGPRVTEQQRVRETEILTFTLT